MFRKKSQSQKTRYFCIGLNKTGTTSLAQAFLDLGFPVDSQNRAHRLMYSYEERNFSEIVEYCRSGVVFQDSPFSMKYTYLFLDQAFENARFILTTRSTSEQWYESFVRYQSKHFGRDGNVPTVDQMKASPRPHGRNVYMNIKMRFGTPDDNIYDKDTLIKYYESHNRDVVDYFRYSPARLLTLNLEEDGAYNKFCRYLGVENAQGDFPWLNQSQ